MHGQQRRKRGECNTYTSYHTAGFLPPVVVFGVDFFFLRGIFTTSVGDRVKTTSLLHVFALHRSDGFFKTHTTLCDINEWNEVLPFFTRFLTTAFLDSYLFRIRTFYYETHINVRAACDFYESPFLVPAVVVCLYY